MRRTLFLLALALCFVSAPVGVADVGQTKPAVEWRMKRAAKQKATKEKYPHKRASAATEKRATRLAAHSKAIRTIEEDLCVAGRACLPTVTYVGPISPPRAMLFAAQVMAADAKKDADAILIRLDSPGGDLHAGQLMYQVLKETEKPVHCVVGATAASAAFWVLQACDRRVALDLSTFVAHEPRYSMLRGVLTVKRLQEATRALRFANRVMTDVIATRMRMRPQALRRRLAQGDWRMTARQALRHRAVDLVVPSVREYRKRLDRHYSRR